MDEILLILLGIAWAIGTPIVAIVALGPHVAACATQNDRLRGRSRGLRRQMAAGAGSAAAA